MLQNDDLERVSLLVRDLPAPSYTETACDILVQHDGDLRLSDVWRLRNSAESAEFAGQMSRDVFITLNHLHEALRTAPENARLIGLEHADKWKLALATAKANADWAPRAFLDQSRHQIVGEACKRLRLRGHKLSIGAYGPDWDPISLRNACASIDHLVSRLGGLTVLDQCAGTINAMGRTFEEIWLLGDRGLGVGQSKEPAVPFGWLLGLAARHMHRPNICRNPATAWRSLVKQARDVSASIDCQRYSQFEEIGGISPSQIDETMSEAMDWRALFFTPQAPRLLLPRLQEAFNNELPTETDRGLRVLVTDLFREMIDLTKHLQNLGCTEIRKAHANRAYPQLCRFAYAAQGSVNQNYIVPVRNAARGDTAFVLFDGPKDTFVARPVAMSIHAFCEILFGLIWKRLGKKAGKVVGNVLERAIANACQGKADHCWHDLKYGPKRDGQQIDVAARSQDQVTLIEVKAKALTREGQIGNSGQFYVDYAQSFLPMVRQLARHDRDVRAGATPIATVDEAATLEIERIAISPVSFGPIGDGMTTTALMSVLPRVRIDAVGNDQRMYDSMSVFNDAVTKTVEELALAIPKNSEGLHKLHDFFIFTRWLDLGQLLFVLDQTDRVDTALRRVRHLTTGSRDFWTEFAFAQSLQTD